MNIRTSDILILRLIEYLLRRNNDFSAEEEQVFENLLNTQVSGPEKLDASNLPDLRQKLALQITNVQNTLNEIHTALASEAQNQDSFPAQSNITTQVPQGDLETFVNVVDDLNSSAEAKLKTSLSNAFVVANHHDYYLWSNEAHNTVSIVILCLGNQGLVAKSLATLGNFVLSELSGSYCEPGTLLQILDKRFREYYTKHKNLPQEISACALMVNRKQAKVSFVAKNMDLFVVQAQKYQKYPGLSGMLGQNQTAGFNEQEFDIKQGTSFYCTNKGVLSAELINALKEIVDENITEKRKALEKWWQNKQVEDLILAIAS